MKPKLRIASCQFSVEPEINHNLQEVLRLVEEAADNGARVVHFSETALSGYAGVDFESLDELDFDALREATEVVCRAAAKHGVWVLLGSTHRLSDNLLPHNSVYVISDQGQIVERYDKRFCTGLDTPELTLDLKFYSPGDHTCVFEIDGWRCGALVCYDYRFPELYRDLKRRGVEIVFQSFHNARRPTPDDNIWKDIVPATMMCRAATNHFWISATNSSTQHSSWPSFCVRPDGSVTGMLELHQPSALYSDVDPALELWDAPGPWRERSMAGKLHSGQPVEDPRSADRQCL